MANIAFLSFYTGVVDRGVENFVYEVAKRLSKKHKTTIFQAGPISHNPGIRYNQIKAFARQPHYSGIIGRLYLDLQSIKILLFSLKCLPKVLNGKYDVIIPVNGGWQTVVFRIVSKLTGAKILISGHAGVGSDDAWNLFFHPDIFIALTSSQESWAKRVAPETKIVKIPNGVDLSLFHPNVKCAKVSLAEPIVICASALVPYKRIELTIRAVAKTKNLSFLLIGDGQLKGQLDSLGKRLLGNRYLRLKVAYKQMPSYYKCAKVFTLVSKTEAFGISYIEALAVNLPIVATNDSSRAEIIGNAGILTNPEDLEKYAKDLTIAARTNYRNVPYNQALKFSWNNIAERYMKVINDLAKK